MKQWAAKYIRENGVNSFVGSIAQMLLGQIDSSKFTDLRKIGYKPEHTKTISRVVRAK